MKNNIMEETNNNFRSEYSLRKQIDKNTAEIDMWLNGDYPLELVYMRIEMLSEQNKRLISRLKSN
jgi:hypothetical protein